MVFLTNQTHIVMKGFIEVTALSRIESYDKDFGMTSRYEKEIELINIDNIAMVTIGGSIILKRGYPNGDNVCKTDHTLDEIKEKLRLATI